jgi:hypothetical protein
MIEEYTWVWVVKCAWLFKKKLVMHVTCELCLVHDTILVKDMTNEAEGKNVDPIRSPAQLGWVDSLDGSLEDQPVSHAL